MNSYTIYKEMLPTGRKSMSTSNYTIKIHDALCEEWWQEKKRTTGTAGTKNAGTKSKHLRKLPVKQHYCACARARARARVCVWCVCVCLCVSPLISLYGHSQ